MKTNFAITFVMLLIFVGSNNAQVNLQWVANYNSPTNGIDAPVAITTDNAGNIYVTGVSPASGTSTDFTTVKYNPSGIEQWASRYHNPAGNGDYVKGIAVDASGNVYVTGTTALGGSNNLMITIKYNSSGVEQWVQQLGLSTASPASVAQGRSPIAIDASGNIYVGGMRTFGSGQNSSYLLVKYNSNGDSLWTRTYKGTHFLAGLGSGIVCIKVDGNSVIVTGKSFDQNPNLTSSCYATTIKYDLSGNSLWMRKDSLINGSDEVIGMTTDVSGNVIVTCKFGFNVRTFKYSSNGAFVWQSTYTGISGDYYDEVTALAVDPVGNVYLTGNSERSSSNNSEDFMIVKYSPAGVQLWERFYDGTRHEGDYANGIAVDNLGNVYVTGTSYDTGFDFNFMTVKYDTDGTLKWTARYDGGFSNRSDKAVDVILDVSGNVIVIGFSSRGTNFDDFATVKYSQTVGVNQISSQNPESYSLSQNFPNPFNPGTKINYSLPASDFVSFKVFDVSGKQVDELIKNYQQAGNYEVYFDASALTSGIYFYRLQSGNYSATKKMILVR